MDVSAAPRRDVRAPFDAGVEFALQIAQGSANSLKSISTGGDFHAGSIAALEELVRTVREAMAAAKAPEQIR